MKVDHNGGLGVSLPWGGETRLFKLTIASWRRLESKLNAGPEEIIARLAPTVRAIELKLDLAEAAISGLAGRYRYDDVREIILEGLIGGDPSLGPMNATHLVQRWVDAMPIRENVVTAYFVAVASVVGFAEASPKKGEGEDGQAPDSPTRERRSPTSTEEADGRA